MRGMMVFPTVETDFWENAVKLDKLRGRRNSCALS
jgi:hypothetical protein